MATKIRGNGNPSDNAESEGGAYTNQPTATHLNLNHYNTQRNNGQTTNNTNYSTTRNHSHRQSIPDAAREWNRPRHEGNNAHLSTTTNTTLLAEIAEAEQRKYTRWNVPRVGNIPSERPTDTFRIMSGQLNGMCSTTVRDRKLRQIEEIIDKWDVQAGCFQEVGINWSALPRQEQMTSWFRHNKASFATTTSHNTTESLGQRQQGGVAIIIGDELRMYAKEHEPDFRGLGRWCSWRLYSSPGHVTRIVSTYNVGRQKPKHLGTIYQQHLRHIQISGLDLDPLSLFMKDSPTKYPHGKKTGNES